MPSQLSGVHRGESSTQQTFGRVLVDLARAEPELASRLVTVSPDVASSTNLGGWINRVGVWNLHHHDDWFGDDADTVLKWRESAAGQHIELGIAEGNLVGLLSELGLTWARDGQALIPLGTLYDPFVNRALEPWSFGIYSGARSILVGTPSGVSLAPEGGAHQSIVTPSIGLEQPRCIAWEPAFGQDLEWILLDAMSHVLSENGSSAYLRLSTRPVDQALAAVPSCESERAKRRRQCLAGGYLLRTAAQEVPAVTLVGVGAIVPEVLAAASELSRLGVESDVVCITSADLVFRAMQARMGLLAESPAILDELLPERRRAPMVTVIDGHPHTLSFLAGVRGVRITCLGVSDFGQSGDVENLYAFFGIDTETIVGAAFDLFDEDATS